MESYESIKSSANQLHRTGRSRVSLSDAKTCMYRKALKMGEGSRIPLTSVGLEPFSIDSFPENVCTISRLCSVTLSPYSEH